MSLYYDLVINCYFREDISSEHEKVLQWLVNPEVELDFTPQLSFGHQDHDSANAWKGNVWDLIQQPPHMLAPNPEYQIISQLRRIHYQTLPAENNREVHLWLLQYVGRSIHDDGFYQHYLPCVHWLAGLAKDHLVGLWRETNYAPAETYMIYRTEEQ